jgi:hypothetical protein
MCWLASRIENALNAMAHTESRAGDRYFMVSIESCQRICKRLRGIQQALTIQWLASRAEFLSSNAATYQMLKSACIRLRELESSAIPP